MKIHDAEEIRLADEVWIATALLHQEHPDRNDFTVKEIVDRANSEAVGKRRRSGIYQHAQTHCVANREPAPARLRMLFATGRTTRRLYRVGDPYHPKREGGRSAPDRDDLPSRYRNLLDWYEKEYVAVRNHRAESDPLLQLRGLGKEIWQDEKADDYVRRLRQEWA
jgi:hypothetical protein